MKKLYLLLLLLLFPLSAFPAEYVVNGNFTTLSGWTCSTTSGIDLAAEKELSRVHISNTAPEYKNIFQEISIDRAKVKQITVKARIKIRDVIPGRQEWEMARIIVLFFDENGKQVGGWPELGRFTGTFDWSDKIQVMNVPEGAAKIKLMVELSNCMGDMWVTGLSITDGDNLVIPRADDDLVMNGDMEYGSTTPLYWGGWVNGHGEFSSPGYDSPNCYKVENKTRIYSMITQKIPIDTKKMYVLIVSGWVKYSNIVQGTNPWEKARISLVFLDVNGNRIGDWPPVVGEADGDINDWTQWEKTYLVPEKSAFVQVEAGLLNCTGIMYFDKIRIEARDRTGNIFKNTAMKAENRSRWHAFSTGKDPYTKDAVIDLSGLNDIPAGGHGYIKSDADGSLSFADGTPAKFWGTDLVAGDVFRTHDETDLMVKRLSKLGVNIVRLHHMDAPWADPGIFDNNSATTREFSKDSLDKLDYLISKLKEAGIYVFLDFLVHREAKSGDGVDNYSDIPKGFKEVIFFDDRLKELTKEYMKSLLTHVNAYTKTSYLQEPAIVFSEIVNESSLFYIDRNKEVPQRYIEKLNNMFNKYLKDKYGSMDKMRLAWQKYNDSDLLQDENFDNGTVKREDFVVSYDDWKGMFKSHSTGRGADTKLFYCAVEKKFYDEMTGYAKSLGYRALLTGSNHWELWDAELYVNSSYDFIDRHSYWDHPNGGWTMQENIQFRNAPIIRSEMNCVSELAGGRILNKPFTVSEWNWVLPNRYRTGGPVIMASYAALQGWDAMMQFNFSNYEWKDLLTHFADFSKSPETLSQWLPAVMIFREGYIDRAKHELTQYVSPENMFYDKDSSFKYPGGNYSSAQCVKIAKTFDSSLAADVSSDLLPENNIALSDTNQLSWDFDKGQFRISAPKIQGATGFISGEKLNFSNLDINCATEYASIYLLSLNKKDISVSNKLILNVAGITDNTGVKYSPAGNSVIYGGSSPIVVEPVYSKCMISPGVFRKATVYNLDANGYKNGEYRNVSVKGGIITITTDERSKTFNYYIELKR
jgi:hypothetical protein